jgi:hypothetical protein
MSELDAPRIYAFDVDETLEVSGGPVKVQDLVALWREGHVLGICGNYHVGTHGIPFWHRLFSFLGSMGLTKAEFLRQIRTYCPPASDYVMVGNDHTIFGASRDREAAEEAGWRFIREHDFAAGAR